MIKGQQFSTDRTPDVPSPTNGEDRNRRLRASAPLAKGVKGRTEALGNMTPQARNIAELKTKARATSPTKGKPGGNIVNKTTGVATGSTAKDAKFEVKPKRVDAARLPNIGGRGGRGAGGFGGGGGGPENIMDVNR